MGKKLKLSDRQHQIIKEICDIQIDSLMRIYQQELDQESLDYLHAHDCDRLDYEECISESTQRFEKVVNDGESLLELNRIDISIFRHILTQIEDQFDKEYHDDIRRLWTKLLLVETVYLKSSNHINN